jgi:hypothetical protein
MGQEIAKAQHEGSAATPHRRKKGSPSVTLSEISVTKRQSSEWQQLAAVDDETFDAALRTAREKGKLSLSAVRGLLKPPPVDRKAKAKSGKVRSKRRVPQEPNAEEMARSRLTQFFMNTKHYAQLIGELGTPEEVIERTTKAAKGKERRLFDQAEFYRIDPATLYQIADFLTAVAKAAEDAAP